MAALRRLALRSWNHYNAALDSHPIKTRGKTAFVIFTLSDGVRQWIVHSPPSLFATNAGTTASSNHHIQSAVSTPGTTYPPSRTTLIGGWFDPVRNVRLSGFYALVHAPWVHTLYVGLERAFGSAVTPAALVKKVAVDQFVGMPAFMAVLLCTQGVMSGLTLAETDAKLRRDFFPLVSKGWLVWIPVISFSFAVVPFRYRLLFANVVQVAFGVYVSKVVNTPAPMQAMDEEKEVRDQ